MQIFTQSFQNLERVLSATAKNHQAIASNIANVDTPNYKTKRVDFQATLSQAIQQQSLSSYKTNNLHIPFSSESTTNGVAMKVNNTTKFKENGNNVDMDVEMADLAKNQLLYSALTDRINGKFNSLRSVINEGR